MKAKLPVALLLALTLSACSQLESKRCVSDADCGGGECRNGVCSNLEPGDGADAGDAGHDAWGDASWNRCEPDLVLASVDGVEDCYERCVDGQCGTGMNCLSGICLPGSKFVSVLIEFSTESQGDCAPSEPGPDLMWVRLESGATGTSWARVLESNIVPTDNDYQSLAHLDGDPPAYDPDTCPPFDADSVVSLGCEGGFVFVEFVDVNGSPVAMQSGDVVTVGEYGPQCGGVVGEESEVRFCKARDRSSCQGGAFGGPGILTREVY